MVAPIPRADALLQSVQLAIVEYLDANDYGQDYTLTDAYPTSHVNPLTTSLIIVSSGPSDPSRDVELGGPLAAKRRRVIADVLGSSEAMGRALAHAIEERFESGEPVSVKDFGDSSALEDYLIKPDNILCDKVGFTVPEPWQKHWYAVQIAFEDEFQRLWLS